MTLKNFVYGALVSTVAAAFVVGSATTSEAAKKKKAAAAAPKPAICFMYYQPVCATKGKTKATYSNACWAARDGAKVKSQGACKVKKAAKKKSSKKKM
jgi:hypothetical protein